MEIEVHQLGGLMGLDRRYLVKDGHLDVIDKGGRRKSLNLAPEQVDRIDRLAKSASQARVEKASGGPVSDSMQTTIDIRRPDGSHSLQVKSGDSAPREVWDLIGEVSKAGG